MPNPALIIEDCDTTEESSGYTSSRQSDLNNSRFNKFLLVIDLPKCFDKLKGSDDPRLNQCNALKLRKLQVNVFGNIVPEIEVPSIDVAYSGRSVKASSLSRPAYRPITVNYTVDNQFENYYVIYKWLDIMNNEDTGSFDAKNQTGGNGKLESYTAVMSLYPVDEVNRPIARWDFVGAFPVSQGGINFSTRNPDELETEFTFEFSFMNFKLV